MQTASTQHSLAVPTRRDILYGFGAGIGSLALTSLLNADAPPQADSSQPTKAHHPPRAKRCIFLMMEGGPSHLDTFDPKPELNKRHLQEFTRSGKEQSAMSSGKRYFVKSPFEFKQAGECGADISTEFEHLQTCVDDICFYRGAYVESVNHPTACYHVNTGNRFGGDPALGAWVTYGLGTENQNLPGFVVLPRTSYPQGGAGNWSNGFFPAQYQGTPLRAAGSPILDLNPPTRINRDRQRENLDLLASLNREHLAIRRGRTEVLDFNTESESTLQMYGIDQPKTETFGRKCLLARRLIEKGVRFVQVYSGNWDSHDYIHRAHGSLINAVDKPIAALLKDLKQRGLLKDTLVVCCGEFGRTPDNGQRSGGKSYGRDHNANAMAMWFAGGGTKAGHTIGATDEIGGKAVECAHHIRDVHVTLLHLLGLDDNRLTFYHAGRFKQLSQFGGQVINELLG